MAQGVKPRRKDRYGDGSRVYPMTSSGTQRFTTDLSAWEKQQGQIKAMKRRPVTEAGRV